MSALLFRPFDLGNWFALGFTAWLATLGESGEFSANFSVPREASSDEAIAAFLREHFAIVATGAGLVLVFGLAMALVLLWVKSRGKFMFLDNVLNNRRLIAEPWRRFRAAGNSYFRWTLVLILVVVVVIASLAGTGIAIAWPAIRLRSFDQSALLSILITGPLLLLTGIATGYVALFLDNFIAPLMYRYHLTATTAWRAFRRLLGRYPGAFIVYGLFVYVLVMAATMALLLGGCVTCCCGFIVLAIPYLGAVLMLPLTVFFRLYSVEFLKQFGPEWNVEAPDAPPPLP